MTPKHYIKCKSTKNECPQLYEIRSLPLHFPHDFLQAGPNHGYVELVHKPHPAYVGQSPYLSEQDLTSNSESCRKVLGN